MDANSVLSRAVTEVPAIDVDVPFERLELDGGSWIDVARGWLQGADAVYESGIVPTRLPPERFASFVIERSRARGLKPRPQAPGDHPAR